MPQTLNFQVTPEQAQDENFLRELIARELRCKPEEVDFVWRKRSIDARKRQIKINASFEVFEKGEKRPEKETYFKAQDVSQARQVAIIGAGPAGLFAALKAIELGLKPVIFERGKDVRSRRRDLAKLNKEGIVNPYYILDPKKEYLFTGLEEHKDKINEFRPWLEALVKK